MATDGWRGTVILAGMLLAGMAQAQQASAPAATATADEADAPTPPTAAQGNVTTLGEVRAIKPEDDQPLDLYRFKSPVQPTPNRFSKNWHEPPSPEQVSISGGYLMMGVYYGIGKIAQGVHKLTNAPDDIQSAIARPPPELTPDQQRRAAAFCEQGGCVPASDGR